MGQVAIPGSAAAVSNVWTQIQKFVATTGTIILGGTQVVNSNPILPGDAQHLYDFVNNATPYQVLRYSTYGDPGPTLFENNVHFQRARGTLAAPTAIQTGDVFLSLGLRGHDGTSITNSAAAIRGLATENWNVAAHGMKWSIETTANGSILRLVRVEIADTGAIVHTPNDGTATAVSTTLATNGAVNHILTNSSNGNANAARYVVVSEGTNVSMWAVGASNITAVLVGGPAGAQGIVRTLNAAPVLIGVNNVYTAGFDNSAVAGDTRFLVYDVTAGVVVRVSRGAADSGGVGFRALRVPN